MKVSNLFKVFFMLVVGFLLIAEISSCTHDDQDVNEFINEPGLNDTELVAKLVQTQPVLDGSIDAAWEDAKMLVTNVKVPDVDFDNFKGYVGDSYEVTMRAMYDNNNVYILAEWPDNNLDFNRETWYFNPDTKRWMQENRYPEFNGNGVMVRGPFYEDKFAVLWNVNNSVEGWNNSTCYASCHAVASEQKVRHYTKAGETIDMWHWKSVRTGPNNQIDDQFQDWKDSNGNDLNLVGGGNGRHSDAKESGGYVNNKQEMMINGVASNVPKYVIPARENYYWITQAEIDNGTAMLITNVDENGILTFEGGSIDPNTDVDYQRNGITTGSKCIPSIHTSAFVGSRGDISAQYAYTGSGWILEIQRALKTGDVDAQDIDFSGLEDAHFGIGVFDNAAIAHAIKANLVLKFEK